MVDRDEEAAKFLSFECSSNHPLSSQFSLPPQSFSETSPSAPPPGMVYQRPLAHEQLGTAYNFLLEGDDDKIARAQRFGVPLADTLGALPMQPLGAQELSAAPLKEMHALESLPAALLRPTAALTPEPEPKGAAPAAEKPRRSWRGKYTSEVREKARALKAQGYSLQKIAQTLGVGSPGTVRRWLCQAVGTRETLGRRGRPRTIPAAVEEKIVAYVRAQHRRGVQPSSANVVEHLRASGETLELRPKRIGELLRRHGISMKQRQQRLVGEYCRREGITPTASLIGRAPPKATPDKGTGGDGAPRADGGADVSLPSILPFPLLLERGKPGEA